MQRINHYYIFNAAVTEKGKEVIRTKPVVVAECEDQSFEPLIYDNLITLGREVVFNHSKKLGNPNGGFVLTYSFKAPYEARTTAEQRIRIGANNGKLTLEEQDEFLLGAEETLRETF